MKGMKSYIDFMVVQMNNFKILVDTFSITVTIFSVWYLMLGMFVCRERRSLHRIIVAIAIVLMEIAMILLNIKLHESFASNILMIVMYLICLGCNYLGLKINERLSNNENNKKE